jgi:cytochrome c-type biogenesis protein CcmH
MNFWIISIAMLAVSAAVMCWPLFTGSTKDRINGILLMLFIPIIGIVLYQQIGTPEALNVAPVAVSQQAQSQEPHANGQADMETMVAQLKQRMVDNPGDPDGWLILGRTLKTMERYTEAEEALANANLIAPNTPLIMIELAETRLFASGSREISADAVQLIEAALEIDPEQQKGLWLMGMVAAQNGDEVAAIASWQSLLALLEPESGPAQAVTQQIETAKMRMSAAGMDMADVETPVAEELAAPEPVATTNIMDSGIPVTITLAGEFTSSVPANAALFVFVHPAGGAGMPLAVKRLAARGFPLMLNFSDADMLRPGTTFKDFEDLDVSARISISGIANAASGDFQAGKVSVNTKAVKPITLSIDKRLP